MNSELANKIIDYENANMPFEQITPLFQELIDAGIVWELKGSYGLLADHLIAIGECHAAKSNKTDS